MRHSLLFASLKNAYGRNAYIITGLVTAAPGFYGFIASKTALPSIPTVTVMIVVFMVCAVLFSVIRIYRLEEKLQPTLALSIGPKTFNFKSCASVRVDNVGGVSANASKVRLLKIMYLGGDTVFEHRDSLMRLDTDGEVVPIRPGEDKSFIVAEASETVKGFKIKYWRSNLRDTLIEEGEYLLEIQVISESTPETTELFKLFPGDNGPELEKWSPENT